VKSAVWKAYFDFEKEEKWLNEMAAKGLNFVHYSFLRYTFEEGTPGEYIYRIELLKDMPSHPESRAYIKFMEETGVEYVDSYFRWVYFRKKAAEGPFDLYSDIDSRIKHYKRVASFVGVVGLINILAGMSNIIIGLTTRTGHGFSFNIYISLLNWFVVILLVKFFVSIIKKIRNMEKDKQLYE